MLMTFDIVIPIGPNDINLIKHQIEHTKKYIIGYRNIYLISFDPTICVDGCITISENIFPFSLEFIAQIHGKSDRNGWYLQQLLKLYAGFIIPNILDKYLVIDADTYFFRPTIFIDDNKPKYNYGDEYHEPYFNHMKKLHNTFEKVDPNKSGICHHMFFETKYVKEIFDLVEKQHEKQFYIVFLECVDDIINSGASEYEIYFNYILKYHKSDITIRQLNWKNDINIENSYGYDYISCHWYLRAN